MVAVIHGPGYARYDLGASHPFSPVRAAMTLDLLDRLGHPLITTPPPLATREEVLTVHDEEYVRVVETSSTGSPPTDLERFGLGTADNPVFPGLDEATRALVGGTLHAARLIGDDQARRVLQLGGGLHHARRELASGFCVYNDLAVAISELTRRGMWVAYLDLDVHHGDGVQEAFYRDDHVLTISLHESGQYLFPGTGGIHELGEGTARGLSVNVPLEPFTDGDSYRECFERVVPAALASFGPQVLVVQAGADAHFDDPLADLALTTHDYEWLFDRVLALAEEHTEGRVLFTLGGGYSRRAAPRVWAILALRLQGLPVPEAIPPDWAKRWRRELGGRPARSLHDAARAPLPRRDEVARHNHQVVSRLLDGVARYWL